MKALFDILTYVATMAILLLFHFNTPYSFDTWQYWAVIGAVVFHAVCYYGKGRFHNQE